jgi:hypothetical protein
MSLEIKMTTNSNMLNGLMQTWLKQERFNFESWGWLLQSEHLAQPRKASLFAEASKSEARIKPMPEEREKVIPKNQELNVRKKHPFWRQSDLEDGLDSCTGFWMGIP